jgi:DNA end-binding protein Ku
VTLRYPYEVRKQSDYFDDIPDEKIPKDMFELASHIVKSKAGHFHPEKFEDQYEDALKELLRKKQVDDLRVRRRLRRLDLLTRLRSRSTSSCRRRRSTSFT